MCRDVVNDANSGETASFSKYPLAGWRKELQGNGGIKKPKGNKVAPYKMKMARLIPTCYKTQEEILCKVRDRNGVLA